MGKLILQDTPELREIDPILGEWRNNGDSRTSEYYLLHAKSPLKYYITLDYYMHGRESQFARPSFEK